MECNLKTQATAADLLCGPQLCPELRAVHFEVAPPALGFAPLTLSFAPLMLSFDPSAALGGSLGLRSSALLVQDLLQAL